MKRIAFIDLGSNSVRFVISEILDNGSYQLIYQQKESIRLSEGLSAGNRLIEPAIDRAIRTLKAFAHMAEVMQADTTLAVATAAVRLADNGDDFIRQVQKETGFKLQCISGTEEARLGFLGVINTLALEDFVLFDLGGASIEITLVRNRTLQNSVSLPMGALTVTEKFQKGRELSSSESSAMSAYINKVLKKEKWLRDLKLPLVGIGGTIRNLGKIDQRALNYPIAKLHNYCLTGERLDTLFTMVQSRTLSQRRKISGLSQERADIIIAGTMLVKQLLEYVGGSHIFVSGCGLREGLFYDYYGQLYDYPNGLIPDILQHSARNILISSPQSDETHATYISRLTDMLYTQWQPLHNCPPRTRELLHSAALLHDVGKRINYYSHARHSAYIIVNANLYGLTHQEQALCAFMAAYSHGNNAKLVHSSPYARLLQKEDWATVEKASLLLALAEAIDESHEQSVISVSTKISSDTIALTIWTKPRFDYSLAQVVMGKLTRQCKKDYGRTLTVTWQEGLA